VERTLLKSLVPPALLGPLRRLTGTGLRMAGPFPDWDAARRASGGYDAPQILERVVAATREVVAGHAAFERDSMLFSAPQHRFPLLASLMHAAARSRGRLHVIDFGGALGSLYWQYRQALVSVSELRWIVVEQPAFVEAGRREFASGPLAFATTLEEAAQPLLAPLLLASSALQYLERPYEPLQRAADLGISALLIDRTPVSDLAQDQACVQSAARRVYDASYPSWVLSRARLMDVLQAHWALEWNLPCDEGQHRSSRGLRFAFEGFYLERRA
jgi:putative methyltransferase (TIGR04325 family)